jgi:hypothetical protein
MLQIALKKKQEKYLEKDLSFLGKIEKKRSRFSNDSFDTMKQFVYEAKLFIIIIASSYNE